MRTRGKEHLRLCAIAAELHVKVYLQFDGFESGSIELLRGKDLVDTKLRALDALGEAGVHVVLVGTIAKGVNDHEIGAIVKLASTIRPLGPSASSLSSGRAAGCPSIPWTGPRRPT
jgi:uncharacterized radical SAM superfamily Fe-S cluster-containing enzyme